MAKDITNENQTPERLPFNDDLTAGQFFLWETELHAKYSLEELEANPALLTMIPEERRADYLKEQRLFREEVRKLREKMEEVKASIMAYRETYPDQDDEWNRVQAAAIKRYGLTEEEFNNIIIQAPEANSMNFGDFFAQSATTDGELLIGGLLDTILQRAREENRPVSEVVHDLQEALSQTGETEKIFLPMPYNRLTDALAYISEKNASLDNKALIIDALDARFIISEFEDMSASLSISQDKLMSLLLYQLHKNNTIPSTKGAKNRHVILPLKETAILLNYDAADRKTSTPEEEKAERKRVKAVLDNARKKINRDGDILWNMSVEWYDEKGQFKRRRIIDEFDLENGVYTFAFSPEMADLLVSSRTIAQYDTNLLKIDERRPNAYRILKQMNFHYNMPSNQAGGTANRLKVSTILEKTDLPSYEQVQKKSRGHWAERIKEPLEKNLDYLTQNGMLLDWKYTHEKGQDLTDEEAANITSYFDYINLLIEFTPAHAIDHAARIEDKRNKKKQKAVKQ